MSLRFDSTKIADYEKLDDGRLRVRATFSRVGSLRYLKADGTYQEEIVTAEELFREDSLQSAALAPVTLGHPPVGMVTPQNYKQYVVGSTGSKVIGKQDAGLVEVVLTVNDAEAIESIESGKTRQISAGYTTEVKRGDDGRLYQTNRSYNHVALCQFGRAGSDVRVHFDSEDWAIQSDATEITDKSSTENPIETHESIAEKTQNSLDSDPQVATEEIKTDRYITRDEFEKTIAQFSPSKEQPKDLDTDQPDRINSALTTSAEDDSVPTDCNREDNIQMKKWKGYAVEDEKLYDAIVGMESEMESMRKKSKKDSEDSDSQVESLQSEITQLKQKIDAAETERDKAQVKADMLQPEIDRLKTESANRIDSNQVGEIVKRHLKVWDSARPYLGKETKLDAASQPIEMMKEAIKTRYPNLNMENRKDEAIETAFEMLLQEHPVKRGDESTETAEISMSKLDELMTQAALGGHAGNTADPTDRQDAADDREKLRQKMAEQIEMNGKGVKK